MESDDDSTENDSDVVFDDNLPYPLQIDKQWRFLFQISMNVKAQTNAMKKPTALTPMDLTPVPANRDSLEMGQLVPVWVFYLPFRVCYDPGYG